MTKDLPTWWNWDVELTSHVEKRMEERGITEVELRALLEQCVSYRPATAPERWIVAGRRAHERWEVIVEPDPTDNVVVIVTVYRVD